MSKKIVYERGNPEAPPVAGRPALRDVQVANAIPLCRVKPILARES